MSAEIKLVVGLVLAALLVAAGWKVNQWRIDAGAKTTAERALTDAKTAWAEQHKRDADAARADHQAAVDLSGNLAILRGQVSDLQARIAAAHLTRPAQPPQPGAPAHDATCSAGLSADFRLLYNAAFGVPAAASPKVPTG